MREFYQAYLDEFKNTLQALDFACIASIAQTLDQARHAGKQVFVLGNGGSAASAAHWNCDLGKGAAVKDVPRFRVQSLSGNIAWLTALANDISYDDIFVEQLKNSLDPEDVVVGLSVSGDSENIVRAFTYARKKGARVIGIVGNKRGRMAGLADIVLVVPSANYGIVEDVHMFVAHVISQYLQRQYEKRMGGSLC